MKRFNKNIRMFKYGLLSPCVLPSLLFYYFSNSQRKNLISGDIDAAVSYCYPGSLHKSVVLNLIRLLVDIREFRNIFYYRIGQKSWICNVLFRKVSSFEISCPNIGSGCFVEHATSTYLNAEKIGNNFSAKQNVTVGWCNGKPLIGDNVSIGTGAVVLGPIRVGDNVKIGANAIVTKNVPCNTTVISPHSYISRQNGFLFSYAFVFLNIRSPIYSEEPEIFDKERFSSFNYTILNSIVDIINTWRYICSMFKGRFYC